MLSRARTAWLTLAVALAAASLAPGAPARAADGDDPLAWPENERECRPWARWWWLGSAVDRENLTRLLERYRAAGLGGVEICPIYGAKGAEDRFIDFLSPRWVEMLAHTTTEAKRLGLGVDLTTGTGWPFGGPNVSAADASSRVVLKRYDLAAGARIEERLPPGTLQCLRAVSDDGRQVDLTPLVKDGRPDWVAPAGAWRVYAVVEAGPVQKVKRAAPGGEGNVLDPYSVTALDAYLARFDRAFAGYRGEPPRAHFHDSFEYYGATWTPRLFDEFRRRRGYDLREHLPALFGEGPEETVARVKCDYRETISDLHLAYVARWTDWAHARGGLSRDQAHGAPANLIDLYAAADVPETELFGPVDERLAPMLKFSSSAAHLGGRALASAESFTWLGEHFQVSLADVKPAADFLFLCGVNQIIFHGIPYSPADVAWPGWLFYASVNFGPEGGLWHDLPAFNAYVARCQSVLRSGRPSNDVLLYFPVYDLWQAPGGLLVPFGMPGKWLWPEPFFAAAMTLWERGYGFDEVSDQFLDGAEVEAATGAVRVGGNTYRAVVVPRTRVMPPATLARLIGLARAGATVVVQGALPADVPGLADLDRRRGELRDLLQTAAAPPGTGKGALLVGDDLDATLRRAGVAPEPMADAGLRFVRRAHARGYHYFLVNRGDRPVDGWVALATPAKSAAILDPRFDRDAGAAALRNGDGGRAEVYLQLRPGESLVLRTFTDPDATRGARPWRYGEPAGKPEAVAGAWKVEFIEGGPALPPGFETRELASWTALGGPEAKRFAGKARYTITLDRPGDVEGADEWLLDLGRVCESARVRWNGREVATLWSAPLQVRVGGFLRPGRNVLEVDVTNLAANRIADLDRRGVNWKSFHEINFVNVNYKPFDASGWPPRDSGLLGPVRLIPLKTPAAVAPGR
jgi:hypothetical protein